MMASDSNHEVPLDGFDVHGASDYIAQPTLSSTAPNQALPLVSRGSLFSGSATVNSAGVSETDGLRLHSSGSTNVDRVNSVGILPGIDNRGERTSPSNPKSFKKKNTYYQRRTGEKKERLIWTQELHQRFLEFYNRFPDEKRVPKKILEEMRQIFPYITRENVASHLQKHRLYLKNLQNKEMGNSAKSSSKSVPRKVAKEEFNFHHFNNNTSISTFPNDAAQFPLQSHSISTSPNNATVQFPLQSRSIISTSPKNAAQFPLQSHSISTSPKNAAQFPLQSHSIFTSPNPQLLLQSHSISTNPNSQLPLQSHSISTSPNNAAQFPFQSHSISTNPNSQLPLQSHSISTNPNFQLPLQSHSLSPSPNYHLPLQSHSNLPETFLNQVVSQIDQTHLPNQNILHMQSSIDIGRNNVSIHGGDNIYSNYNLNQMMDNVFESQRNPFGQSSNAVPDFPVRVNPFHPSIPTNIHDPYFDGNAFYPIIMGNSFRDLSGFDYSFGALPYFLDYNMSFNLDNFQVDGVYNMNSLGSYSDALLLDCPFNYTVANELQPQDFGQVFQPIFYPPANHLVDDASSMSQNSENPREEGAGMKERNGNSSNSPLPDGWSGL